MREKRKTHSRKCVVIEIATCKRTEARSISHAAQIVDRNASFLSQVLRAGMNTNGYVVAYIEDEERAIEKLRNIRSRGQYVRSTRREISQTGKVPLRIDARTIIYVKPEEANEAYAEYYRTQLKDRK